MPSGIDREGPRHRPSGFPLLKQRWRDLLLVHYRYPRERIAALLPDGLSLDTDGGDAIVSLTPFKGEDMRAGFAPRWFGADFYEANVRTYVHHEGWPGIFFFSLEAASTLAVLAARAGLGLPYRRANMHGARDYDDLRYWSARANGSGAFDIAAHLGDVIGEVPRGSTDFFAVERYVMFFEHLGRLLQIRIHHPPLALRAARVDVRNASLLSELPVGAPLSPPERGHFVEHVDVDIFAPQPLSRREQRRAMRGGEAMAASR